MTTWQHYCDYLKSRGSIESVMIIGSDDAGYWASAPSSFYLKEYETEIMNSDCTDETSMQTVNESQIILELLKGNSHPPGLRINATPKQQILRNYTEDDMQIIIGKFPNGGSCIVKNKKCILIGTFNEKDGHTSVKCNENIILMAKYLIQSQWPTKENISDPANKSIFNDGSITWQAYIDSMLVGKGNVENAIICSKSDGKIWANNNPNSFTFKKYDTEIPQDDGSDVVENVDELKNVIKLVNGVKTPQGLRINEVKYQILRTFDEENSKCYTIYGKKPRGGICIISTTKTIIIATFDEAKGQASAGCNASMSDLGKYLMSKGL